MAEATCCFTEPEIPCNICPDGATVADDYVPENLILGWSCSSVIESAKRFESESDACELHEIDEKNCCPSVMTTTSTNPNPNTVPPAINVSTTPGTVPAIDELLYCITTIQAKNYQYMEGVGREITMAIAGVAVEKAVVAVGKAGVAFFSLMALAIYYLCRGVSNAKDTQTNTPGSCIPMAVTLNMDPETAEAPFSKGYPLPPPYSPHASAPPPYAPHASAPPLE